MEHALDDRGEQEVTLVILDQCRRAHDKHIEILRAITLGEPDRAQNAMRTHLDGVVLMRATHHRLDAMTYPT